MQETVLQTRRSPIRHLTGVQVVSTGSYVPDIVVRNEDLAQMGCDPEWILQRSGIRERRHAPPEMATSDLAVAAAEQCIEASGVNTDDIDLLVVGTFTPDLLCPSTACLVQDRLGINGAAFDVVAACAGFIYSLITAMQYVASGTSNLALVIGADTNSRIANPADVKTYPLFGDGAGAVLITAGDDDQGLLAYTLGSDGSGAELLCRKMGGSRIPHSPEGLASNQHYLEMEGRPIFKWAVRLIDSTVREVLDAAQLEIKDIDVLVLHQANSRIMDAAADSLGIPREKMVVNIDRFGNTSAASIPLALDEIRRNGTIQRGSRIMLCGFGAGLAWGTGLMQW
ncbi:MAG: ketoacyl-ACP synthase III [Planctomycetota bacterium]|nr:ketoacyl-ACP synthase III [Planctomycetota bacterium]